MQPGPTCDVCQVSILNIEKNNLYFDRKVSYSGRSLIVSLPEDLARYMGIQKGQHVKIIPVDKKRFLVEIIEE